MDTSVLTFVVTLCSSIIILLLTVVAFFIKKFIGKVDDISIAVANLCLNMRETNVEADGFEKACYKTHENVDLRLNNNERKISDHEKRIVKLEFER